MEGPDRSNGPLVKGYWLFVVLVVLRLRLAYTEPLDSPFIKNPSEHQKPKKRRENTKTSEEEEEEEGSQAPGSNARLSKILSHALRKETEILYFMAQPNRRHAEHAAQDASSTRKDDLSPTFTTIPRDVTDQMVHLQSIQRSVGQSVDGTVDISFQSADHVKEFSMDKGFESLGATSKPT
ncbi:hypothetical protein BKA70DRAFT_1493938 [Coprinopsis sp. MPI-PUGE-AT-0042]|nr:hypothetical protein BKA70DRAFT_1493938 [Coprinopsis sp. MPI-PUGE-AT-0042]